MDNVTDIRTARKRKEQLKTDIHSYQSIILDSIYLLEAYTHFEHILDLVEYLQEFMEEEVDYEMEDPGDDL